MGVNETSVCARRVESVALWVTFRRLLTCQTKNSAGFVGQLDWLGASSSLQPDGLIRVDVDLASNA